MTDVEATRLALRARSESLTGKSWPKPADMLERVAAWCREHDVDLDMYGKGRLVAELEAKVADRLGYPAARFMPSGTMAQGIAMRIWCDRAKLPHFGMHPTSHLEIHEERGYLHLHKLAATLVGPASRPLLACDLEAVHEPMAALLTELPIREGGGQLPSWDELEELKATARRRDVRLHLDGARLWESGPHYGRPYDAICRGFDSCYVSFYKGIGALSGAMLLGPADFIEEAKLWQRRSGGTLFTLAPNIASAAMRFDEALSRMPALVARAKEIAAVLRDIDGVRVLPDPPHTNMMHIFVPVAAEEAMLRRDRAAEETGLWIFNRATDADAPGTARIEIYIDDLGLERSDDEIRRAFQRIVG